MRRLTAFLGLLLGVLAVSIALAGPAAAHAELASSDPASGARLQTAPTVLTLGYTERISLVRNGIRLLDAAGRSIPTAKPKTDGQQVLIPVPKTLKEGAYILVWRVVSADSHPIQGAVSFAVGNAVPVAAADVAVQAPGAKRLLAVARWVAFCGLVLLLGPPLFVALCWRPGDRDRGVFRLVVSGGAALVVSTLVALLGQGPYAAGTSITTALDTSLIGTTLATDYGRASVFRIVAALGLLLMLDGLRHKVTVSAIAGCLALAGWILVTFAAQGHAVASDNWLLAMASEVVHLGAMAAWIGGLVVLVTRVLVPGVVASGQGVILTRWSRVAVWAVAALVLTGTYQAVREIGSVERLLHSSYGQLLLVKLAIVAVLLGFGNLGRMWVNRRFAMTVVHAYSVKDPAPDQHPDEHPNKNKSKQPNKNATRKPTKAPIEAPTEGPAAKRAKNRARKAPPDLRGLRRSVAVEAGLAVVVLGVTAVLVGTTPGRTSRAAAAAPPPAGPVSAATTLPGGTKLEISVSATRVVTLRLRDSGGAPVDPLEVTVTASLAQRQIQRLPVLVASVGPGVYRATQDPLPFTGTWRFTVTARTSDIDSGVASVTMRVG